MNPLVNQVLDEVRGAWRFRWWALITASALAVGAWLIVFSLPDRYEAVASVFVDTRTSLKPALQGLTVEQDVDSELNFVRQSLLAGPTLQHIAREAGVLAPYIVDPRVQEQIVANMGKHIDISVESANGRQEDLRTAGSIYRIVYQDRKRARALRVVEILLDTFVNNTLGGKREGAENAQQFLQTQIQDYEQRLRTAEERLAQFKSRHLGLMPTEQGGYFAQLQREEGTVTDLRTKLAQAESRRATLTRQLHGDVAVAAAAAQPAARGNNGGLDTLSRIDEAQAHLDDLLLRFTDRHPDVIAARQTLEDLKKRRATEIAGLKTGDAAAAASSRASSNPVYQSVQLALNQADVDIADLNTDLAEHQAKVAQLRRLLDTAPQVEAEYQQLNRDYDVNKAQYTALLANLQKARLGERADSAGSVRFEIVQPPNSGLRPVWPLRALLLAETLVAALAAGGALAYGLHYLRPVVNSAPAIAQAVGVPVLGLVSVAFPQRARAARRRDLLRFSLAGGCLAVAFLFAVFMTLQGYRLSITALKQMVGS
ncbi:MAG TPA: XrtA system polysaccharide chain length determinant [Steroidobacteraceae bacterium]|nr:XrtA system polysaccharide chain length determinant [Steroidobacteraceae bacterium]